MRAISLAEINANNRAFWKTKCAHQDELLQRRYIRRFIKSRFCDPSGPSYCISPSALHQEQSFYAQLFLQKETFSNRQRAIASEPRRKAVGDGRSRRHIIGDFASRLDNAPCRTNSLWKPFYAHLESLGLNPAKIGDAYEYEGKRGRITIGYRQFEKLVSELAPRRKKNSPTFGYWESLVLLIRAA